MIMIGWYQWIIHDTLTYDCQYDNRIVCYLSNTQWNQQYTIDMGA